MTDQQPAGHQGTPLPSTGTPAAPPPPPAGYYPTPPPYAGRAPQNQIGKTRNPWGVWLLSLVTLGIYGLWWYYTVNREVRDFDERIIVQPGMSVVAITFGAFAIYIPPLVSWAKSGGRIASAQRYAGSQQRCSSLIGVLLGLIGFGMVYYQSQLNKVWDCYGNPPDRSVRPV